MVKPSKISKLAEPRFDDIRKWFDEHLDAEKCDLDDQSVYENVYHKGKWAAIFQFTERGAQKFAQRAKPKSITDIAAITSIYRPGPLTAHVDDAYVADKERVESGEKLKYEHPLIEDVLRETYGHMIFQEHFMLIGKAFGLSWEDCDRLRKILVKKSIGTDVNEKKREEALRIKERFKAGAIERGLTVEQVEELWRKMEFFSGYGFNKSLSYDTRVDVYNARGAYVRTCRVCDVRPGDFVKSRDESSGDVVFVEIVDVHDHGVIPIHEFEFDNGVRVRCTPTHKFRTTTGEMVTILEAFERGLDVVFDHA